MATDRYTPTPEQIKQHCAEIRKHWTVEEEQRRRAYTSPPIRPKTSETLNVMLGNDRGQFGGVFSIFNGGGDRVYHGRGGE